MKPKIFRCAKGWILHYHYRPRNFAMYGANLAERQLIKQKSFTNLACYSFEEAVETLAKLYKKQIIYRG